MTTNVTSKVVAPVFLAPATAQIKTQVGSPSVVFPKAVVRPTGITSSVSTPIFQIDVIVTPVPSASSVSTIADAQRYCLETAGHIVNNFAFYVENIPASGNYYQMIAWGAS
jgi:hypothetical protein